MNEAFSLYMMTELCTRYGISRKTGYKWLARFDEAGQQGLWDRSRAPHHCPHRISDEIAALICAARCQHPSRGLATLLDWLGPRHPDLELPAVSTAGNLPIFPFAQKALDAARELCWDRESDLMILVYETVVGMT
jgi:hypothetical protein